MGKKFFSLCMALVLCLGLLPVTALAAAPEGQLIYVGGVKISSSGYWTTDDDGNVTANTGEGTPTDNYIHYDADNNTLTLHNATIKEQLDYSENIEAGTYIFGSAIGVFNRNGAAELTITLVGTNTIAEVGKGIFVLASSTSTGGATLTITGGGSLDASASQTGIWVQSNSNNAALCVKNAEVTASADGAFKNGVLVQAKEGSDVSLTVNGGSLTASVNANIWFQFGSGASGSGTPTVTVSNNAIVRANGGIANNSSTSIQYGTGNKENGGIVWNGTGGTVYGNVTLQESLTINEGETLTIPDDSSLNSNGKLTNNGKIIVDNGGKLEGTIEGNQPPKITTTSLSEGTVNTKYNQTLVASGDATITWSSSDLPNWLTLNSDGTISGTPTAAGTYSFTVTATNDYGSDSKEFTLTIDQQGTIHVTSVSLDKANLELTEGETAQLTATVLPDNATDKSVTWESNAPGVATVDTSGKVTAVSVGTATITATVDGKSATCTVTVEKPYTPPPYIPPTYAVTTPETTGGTVTVSPSRASRGRTVAITATPDLGFALESLTVLDSRGNEIALTDKGDGKYTFTMPASRVTVEASFAPAPLPFEDVAPGAWYEEAVRYAYFHNIMEGMRETEFSPTTALTRAMAAQILYNLEGQPDLSDENLGYPYEDVDAQAWYGNAVYWARITGVATGYGDGTFQPGDSITRQEFAQMLYNYAKYKGYDLTAEGDLAQFPDSESVADWAEAAMRWANGNELINGHDDGTIDAAGIGTRAQAASILMKFDQNLVEN